VFVLVFIGMREGDRAPKGRNKEKSACERARRRENEGMREGGREGGREGCVNQIYV